MSHMYESGQSDESYYSPGVLACMYIQHTYKYSHMNTERQRHKSSKASMSGSLSHSTLGSPSNGGDHVAVNDTGAAGKTAHPKPAARTFVILDVKPWGMLLSTTNIPRCQLDHTANRPS